MEISGAATLRLKGSQGPKGYDGAWGGMNFDDEYDVCFRCIKKIREFVKGATG